MRSGLFANPLRNPLLLSCALHAIALLALAGHTRATATTVSTLTFPPAGSPVEIAVVTPPAPRSAAHEALAAPGGGRPPPARARRGEARPRGLAPEASPPLPHADTETVIAVSETAVEVGAPSPPAESPAPDQNAASDLPGSGEGHGNGDGTGDGDGSGSGDATGDQPENLGKELHARILGEVRVDLPRDDQQRIVLAHDQATALRQRDIFPRLPESLWPEWRPYVVTLRVCVDEQGQVSDATLLSAKAPRLDRMVAAAARSWRYRPFEAAGQPTAFCHGVVIQYEHW